VEAEYENEESNRIKLTQLHELDRQIELLKANLDDLSFLNCVTETTSEMLITKQENVPNECVTNERGNLSLIIT